MSVMPLDNPRPGFNWTAEYAVSGIPWVTSSTLSGVKAIEFQHVTKFVIVKNTSGTNELRVGFSRNGVLGSNYAPLTPGESLSADLRVKTLFLSGTNAGFTVLAGVTMIEARNMPTLTASINGTGSLEGIG